MILFLFANHGNHMAYCRLVLLINVLLAFLLYAHWSIIKAAAGILPITVANLDLQQDCACGRRIIATFPLSSQCLLRVLAARNHT